MSQIWKWIKRIWEFCGSDPEALAQLSHIGWGGFLTLTVHLHYSTLISAVAIAMFAVLKELSEFWTETGETRGSSLVDTAFWWMGILIAAFFRWVVT